MYIIIILIILIVTIFFIMQKYKASNKEVIPAHLSEEVKINEIYLSNTIQSRFYNLNKERLSKEDFKYIIDLQSDEQIKMFLNYMYDRYYGCDTVGMKCIPFSTLIEEASKYSGYRL